MEPEESPSDGTSVNRVRFLSLICIFAKIVFAMRCPTPYLLILVLVSDSHGTYFAATNGDAMLHG